MRKKTYAFLTFLTLIAMALSGTSCNNGETYAQMKDREKDAIRKFIEDNTVVGHITIISEEQFAAQGETTDTTKNEYVLFNDDGIYMQIVEKGDGKTMRQMCQDQINLTNDSTISKMLLCRFMEYDIENAYISATNWYSPSVVDKMLCSYSFKGKSYTASFTEGKMKSANNNSVVVPEGWLKPLDYINLTSSASDEIAKVRLIVPHSSGTSSASSSVLPKYYDISYQLGR